MIKDDTSSLEYLKQFKTGEDLCSFLSQLLGRDLETILMGEFDNHLGYDKHKDSSECLGTTLWFIQ